VLTGRRADVLARAAKKLGRAAAFEAQDIARYDELDDFLKRVQRQAGKISILVNNAGIHLKKPAMDITAPMNRFGTAVDIGLATTYLCSPAASFVHRRGAASPRRRQHRFLRRCERLT
jgi:NAD(P)-dependent dehydrogenase (short-subunit alcohol dehydrogenase family)